MILQLGTHFKLQGDLLGLMKALVLDGPGEDFSASAQIMLEKELILKGSRYATRQEVKDSLKLCARGEVWPLITETAT